MGLIRLCLHALVALGPNAHLLSIFNQVILELGMGYGDEIFSYLISRIPFYPGNAVLSYNIHNIGPGTGNNARHCRNYAGNQLAVADPAGVQAEETFPAFGEGGPDSEVQLAASTRYVAVPLGF